MSDESGTIIPGSEETPSAHLVEPTQAPPAAGRTRKSKKKPKRGSIRGIETMFRSLYRMHIELTAVADTKANIMIGINGVIATVSIGFMPALVADYPPMAPPSSVFVFGSIISLIYAVMAARPRVSSEPVSLADVRSNKASILFFGHFVNMSRDDYLEGMHELMDRPELLYDNMVRDLYHLGEVCARKYQLLRTSYTVFMVTVLVSASLSLLLLTGIWDA